MALSAVDVNLLDMATGRAVAVPDEHRGRVCALVGMGLAAFLSPTGRCFLTTAAGRRRLAAFFERARKTDLRWRPLAARGQNGVR